MLESEHAYKSAWIHTRYGRFDLDTPTFDIRDIAYALPRLVRFNGHTRRFFSVAQHSIMVTHIMRRYTGGDPFEGLMHDATEAYLSDVPSPFKHLLPDWKRIEERVDAAMRYRFKLPIYKSLECKQADWLALFIEAAQLLDGEGADFEDPLNLRPKALSMMRGDSSFDLTGWATACDMDKTEKVFLSIYEMYTAISNAREASKE